MSSTTPTSVPAAILNHPVFQQMLSSLPVDAIPLYEEFLSNADGSPSRVKQILDEYPERMATIPRLGKGIGQKQRSITLEHGVSLALTYYAIDSVPQYLVEMIVRPRKHTVTVLNHDVVSTEETLTADWGVYWMAINQGFRVRVKAGTTRYFTIPEPPHLELSFRQTPFFTPPHPRLVSGVLKILSVAVLSVYISHLFHI
ncbi:hypothetical protein Hypma_010523 [Hypsizygus marmoreus]|uniref:Uncharacterized protein n=1 Tax=Hypsizygus marmoreus TaxID=39966 RepID=A0A369JSK6_HYPMA|nr:hypothetical protein Hypma_010523 [Hypsizygus marmoreus]